MMLSVLIVEDDENLSFEIATYLTRSGFEVTRANSIAQANSIMTHSDLLILDMNLPDGRGIDFCDELNCESRPGVVVCTGDDDFNHKIASLLGFADAYLTKPINLKELEATLISVHRRLKRNVNPFYVTRPNPIPWRLDLVRKTLIAPNTKPVSLLPVEATILEAAIQTLPNTVSRKELMTLMEKEFTLEASRNIEVIISRLRRKVTERTTLKLPLISHYGRGYGFTDYAIIMEISHC